MNFEDIDFTEWPREHLYCRCALVPITGICQWCGQPTDDDGDTHERCKIVENLTNEALSKVT